MERRLLSILAADVVGYSKLMGSDESGTLSALREVRENTLSPLIEMNRGSILKSMGDGWFVGFKSVSDSVSCAIAVQDALANQTKIKLRIGLHVGEVTIADEDIYGDGLNISARLQEAAEPGSLMISDAVQRAMDGKLASEFRSVGPQHLKNIHQPINVFVRGDSPTGRPNSSISEEKSLKPSLVVLPFKSLSGVEDQEFLVDGIVEDLITALARFRWLSVLGRNCTFELKNSQDRPSNLADDLGVRYLVDGSLRASKNRIRLSVQLVDARENKSIWAETYDRPQGDLFELQDDLTRSITGVLVPALSREEMDRSIRSNRPTLSAWESYQRGIALYNRPFDRKNHAAARRHFDVAIERDPGFADAYAMVALMGVFSLRSGQTSYTTSPEEIIAEALTAAEKAVDIDDREALGHMALGVIKDWLGESETAIAECQTAVSLNSNLAQAYHQLGFVLVHANRFAEAVKSFDEAINLSPNDPGRWNFYLVKGSGLYGTGDFSEAIACLKQSAQLRPAAYFPYVFLGSVYVEMDEPELAQDSVDQILKRNPDLTIENLRVIFGKKPAKHLVRTMKNLEAAGLPG